MQSHGKNVAINDVLPLKAARDAVKLLKMNVFGAPGHISDLISMVAFTFAMRPHRIRLASGPLICFRLAKFGCSKIALFCYPSCV